MSKLHSIKVQIISLVVGIGALLSFFMVYVFPSMTKDLSESIQLRDAQFITTLLSDNLALGVETMILDDGDSLQTTLNTLQVEGEEEPTISKVKVFDDTLMYLRGLYNEDDVDTSFEPVEEAVFNDLGEVVRVWSPLRNSEKMVVGYVEIDFSKRFLTNSLNNNSQIALLIGVAALGITIILGWLLASSITKPIAEIKRFMDEAASGAGDLTQSLSTSNRGEVGVLAGQFNTFIKKLHGMMLRIRENTDQVMGASNEIVKSAEWLAQGSSDQLQQTHEVVESVSVISSSMMVASENSRRLAEESKDASRIASDGRSAVERLLAKMTEVNQLVDKSTETIQTLSQRSEEIVKIVDVINEIAGQTNLLALNAAIEAARAGTHGRGFAVVADEIRKLADQTTSSTKGIEDMIANMQSETLVAVKAMKDSVIIVDEGMDVAHRASEVLGEVMDMSNHVSSAIEQLAATAQEQSSASTQINDNISSIASVTERAAQSANQMLSISEELNNQMVSLKQIESQFKL